MTAPLVSVIIPAFQAADNIEACIRSALDQAWPRESLEVIVVDNGSTDATVALARKQPVQLVLEPRRGRSAARNHGARLAKGSFLAFMDADCEAPRDWLQASVAALSRPWLAAAQILVQKHGRPPPASTFTQLYYYRPFLDTCALVTSRDAYDNALGYDEELRRNVDMDFSFRLLACGYAFAWLPGLAMIKHHDLTHRQILRRGWDGGVSVSELARKWPTFTPAARPRVWRDRGLNWLKFVARDARHPLASRGHNAIEASVRLLATAVTDWRGSPVALGRYRSATKLPQVLGADRALVVHERGASVYDARARRVIELDHVAHLALSALIDGGPEAAASELSRLGPKLSAEQVSAAIRGVQVALGASGSLA